MLKILLALLALCVSVANADGVYTRSRGGAGSSGGSSSVNTTNIVVSTNTASNTEVLYASGTTIDGALGLAYDRIQNRVTIGTPTGATPTFSNTLLVSGTARVTGVLTVGSCVGCSAGSAAQPFLHIAPVTANTVSGSGITVVSVTTVPDISSSVVFGNYWDTTNSRFLPTNGSTKSYLIQSSFGIAPNSVASGGFNQFYSLISKNNSTNPCQSIKVITSAVLQNVECSTVVQLNGSTDFVNFRVNPASGFPSGVPFTTTSGANNITIQQLD